MTREDPREKLSLSHEDVVAMNFVRAPGIYFYRRHYRAGLRSHIMQVLLREDLDLERTGVLRDGVRRFPKARPLKMLRLFRTRFETLSEAEEELVRFKIIESYLAPLHMARSNEFLVDLTGGPSRGPLLCGLQEYVEGEMLDPWGSLDDAFLEGLEKRPGIGKERDKAGSNSGEWITAVRSRALIFVDSIKKMATRALRIPDLAGVGDLLLTRSGRIKLVDINNVSRVSFEDGIELDDRGYPVCDKSVEALWRMEKFLA